MDKEEITYLAGFIDADGSIGIQRKGKVNEKGGQLMPRLSIVNDYGIPLLMLQHKYSGRVYHDKQKDGTTSCYFRYYMNKRSDLIRFLPLLIPYLKLKQRQAKLVLAFCESRNKTLSSKPTYREVKMFSFFKKGYYRKQQPYFPYTDFEICCCLNCLYLNLPKQKRENRAVKEGVRKND